MKLMIAMFAVALLSQPVLAEDKGLVKETKEAAQDAAKNTKQAARNAKEKVCEMVNGKMDPKCLAEKVENTGKTVKDEIKDKTH